MSSKLTKLAVIPARGGSKRLKGKNIYPLNGKPLIEYTIESVYHLKGIYSFPLNSVLN